MRCVLAFHILLCSLFLLASCAKAPEPDWRFGEEAITIAYRATLDLNEVGGRPHSLLLVIYQLKDVNAFNRLAGYSEGLKTLLEGKVFDPSVMAMKKVYVEPGGARSLVLDRAENSRYVGLVAGYYSLVPAHCTALVDIEYSTRRSGLFKIWKTTEITPLRMTVVLGRSSMRVKRFVKK